MRRDVHSEFPHHGYGLGADRGRTLFRFTVRRSPSATPLRPPHGEVLDHRPPPLRRALGEHPKAAMCDHLKTGHMRPVLPSPKLRPLLHARRTRQGNPPGSLRSALTRSSSCSWTETQAKGGAGRRAILQRPPVRDQSRRTSEFHMAAFSVITYGRISGDH